MTQPLLTQRNAHSVGSIARVCLLPLLISLLWACSSGSSSNDPSTSAISVIITPNPVTVLQGRSVTIRVDVADLPANASVAGFSSDLPETVADIDITTQSCPSGVGTVSCQDWTITPGANCVPGSYRVEIMPLGATIPVNPASGFLTVRVLADPQIATASVVTVDSSQGRGVATTSLDSNHALFITEDGRLWGYGSNISGAVSGSYVRTDLTGTVIKDVQPSFISEVVPIAGISSGRWTSVVAVNASGSTSQGISRGDYSYALREDGTVWRWGGVQDLSISPALLPVMQSVVGIRALSAIDHDSNPEQFLVLDGALNGAGQPVGTGQVYGGGNSDPVRVSGTDSPLSGVTAIAGGTPGPLAFAPNTPITFFEPQYGNGYVLRADGTPARIFLGWTGGPQFVYRLFSGDMVGVGLSNITQISAGQNHFLGLRSDGVVLAAGKNGSGQLGNGSTIDSDFIYDCSLGSGCDADDTTIRFTNNPVQVTGVGSVTAIAAKADRSFALLADGTVWTWGGGILTPVRVQNLDNVRKIGPGYAIRSDCPGPGGTLWGILFPSGAQPTAERVPLVGDLSACTPPSFALALGAATLNLVAASGQQMTSVNLTRTGYAGDVDLEVLNCPINVQCTASPDPIPGNVTQSTVTIRTTNATPGNYVITVRGSGGGVTREAMLELHILGF